MWSKLAKKAPINPQTGRHYHPQTLARCWRGHISNYMLLKWINKEMQYAKTKNNSCDKGREGTRRKGLQFHEGEVTELSKLTKAIRGKVNTD